MIRSSVHALGIFTFFYSFAFSQSYPTLTHVTVGVSVRADTTAKMFYYSYSLTNDPQNIGKIQTFAVSLARDSTSIIYDTIGLQFAQSGYMERNFRRRFPSLSPHIVPVGFAHLPQNWLAIWGNVPEAEIFKDTLFVTPGGTESNLQMMSKGIPGIRSFRIEPYFQLGDYFPLMNDSTSDDSVYAMINLDSIRAAINFYGTTLGPWAPAARFQPLTFCDTLNSFVSESRSLGWITSQTVANKYSGLFSRIKDDVSTSNLKTSRIRIDTILQQVNADSSSTLTSEAYALIRFNTEYLRDQLKPTNKVKAGILNPTGGTISVKAKPSIAFGSSDILKCMEATIRWLTSCNITLGTVSSPTYGFAKDASVTTVGSYSYQKFRSTTSQTLNWASGTEYELFTVPITSPAGVETYRLTNALSGGEWFVDINYLDKTDSTFYQDTANGFAYQNKSASNNSTWYSGSRHAAMTSSKLHEVYSSGGEIVYRRKNLSGSWEVTTRLSPGNGSGSYPHSDPGILIAHDGSIHVVWQRLLSGTNYSVWYTRSTDGGSTWVTADSLHALGTVGSTSSQGGPKPIITEQATSQVVIVWQTYSSLSMLEYIVSTNLGQSWGSVQQISSVSSSASWDHSVASYPVTNKLLLGYTPPLSYDVFSSVYSGSSWASQSNVSSGVGLTSNKYPSVAFDADQGHFYAAWCGQPSGHSEYVIAFRTGTTSGTWGSPFAQFAIDSTGVSDYYPSITGWTGGDDMIDIIYHTSNTRVKLLQCTGLSWASPRALSTSGQWANTTLQEQRSPNTSGQPIRLWTDPSVSPYQVTLQSDGNYQLQMAQQQAPPTYHRRVVIESELKGSVIWFDLAPIKVVTSAGDTVVLPFTKLDPRKPFDATMPNAWDYLGTDTLSLPSNAKSLVIDIDVTSFAHTNDWGANYTNIFTSSNYEIDGISGGKSSALLANQQGVSGRKVIDISSQAGKSVKLRLLASVPATSKETVAVGVGDVFVNP